MSLCGNYARVIGLEVEAKILRVVGEPLQRMVGVNTRRVRFADILERRNYRMQIVGALAQCPQLVGGTGRQQFDHVKLR
jgi:hypothetical protein